MGEMRREQRLTFLSILSAHGEGQAAPIGLKFPPARQGFGARGIFYRSSIKLWGKIDNKVISPIRRNIPVRGEYGRLSLCLPLGGGP